MLLFCSFIFIWQCINFYIYWWLLKQRDSLRWTSSPLFVSHSHWCIVLFAPYVKIASSCRTTMYCSEFYECLADTTMTARTKKMIVIDLFYKSHNAPDKFQYLTMHHFVTEMCTCVDISVTQWCIVGHGTSALWDLWIMSIMMILIVRWRRGSTMII